MDLYNRFLASIDPPEVFTRPPVVSRKSAPLFFPKWEKHAGYTVHFPYSLDELVLFEDARAHVVVHVPSQSVGQRTLAGTTCSLDESYMEV